jgi:hypothetical protein
MSYTLKLKVRENHDLERVKIEAENAKLQAEHALERTKVEAEHALECTKLYESALNREDFA